VAIARAALLKAFPKFRAEKGVRPATYLTRVVQNALSTATREAWGNGSYLPRRAKEFAEKRDQLAVESGREPSETEVFDSLGWSRRKRVNFTNGKGLLQSKRLSGKITQGIRPLFSLSSDT
jgi:DNA-directed RNA polymerase specialized sigma subunit